MWILRVALTSRRPATELRKISWLVGGVPGGVHGDAGSDADGDTQGKR